MNVPREIDELMWEIAESHDETIEKQFVARYPMYVAELDMRRKLIGDLKGSRPTREPAIFVPSAEVRNFGASRLTVAFMAAILVASFGFASYATVRFLTSRNPEAPIVPPTKTYEAPPAQFSQTPIEAEPQFLPKSNSEEVVGGEPLSAQQTDPYLRKVTLRSEKTTLVDVINEIGAQAGLTITVAPGFVDRTIFIIYEDQPAIGVLNDLGRKYGFTPFEQGNQEILVIPARGSGSIKETGAAGVANEIKEESNGQAE